MYSYTSYEYDGEMRIVKVKESGKENPEEEGKEEPEEEAPAPTAHKRPLKKIKPASDPIGLMDDKELVAAITAAICAYEGTSSSGFVVRSIRRADTSKWKKYN